MVRALGDRLALLVSFLVPMCVALSRTSAHGQWRGDAAALRDILLLPLGGLGGGVSTALGQAMSVLPIGSLTYRTAVVSAVAVGFVGVSLQRIASQLLLALERTDEARLDRPWFAALASLLATLSPAFQREATVGGGAMLAVALALFGLERGVALLSGADERRKMAGLALGAVAVGAAIAEGPAAGLMASLSLTVMVVMVRLGLSRAARTLIPGRVVLGVAVLVPLSFSIAALPNALRHFAPNQALPVGGTLRPLPTALVLEPPLLEGLGRDLGLYAVALSLLGSVVLVLHPRARTLYAGLAAIVLIDFAWRTKLGASESMLGVRLLSLAALCCASTAGLFFATRFLATLKMPAARAVAAMSVAFYATLVVLVAEHGGEQADRASDYGAVRLTDRTLELAPPGAAVVVGSVPMTLRLLVAQWVEGRRADVEVIAVPLLDRGSVALELVAREPATELLLRAVALTGRGDELSLARLSDARHLLLEYDRAFDHPTQRHLLPAGYWLSFHTDPPSRAERRAAFDATRASLGTAISALGELRDPGTTDAATSLVRGQAKLALQHGDHALAERHLRELVVKGPRTTLDQGSLDVLFLGAVSRLSVVQKVQQSADKERERARKR